jgi:hypothetical protein
LGLDHNSSYVYFIENTVTYSGIRIKGKNGVNEWIDLGTCGDAILKSEWEVYPNPISDIFKLNYTGAYGLKLTEINIINPQGSIVYRKTSIFNNGYFEMNLAGLCAGIYTLTIKTGDKIKVFKLVKI